MRKYIRHNILQNTHIARYGYLSHITGKDERSVIEKFKYLRDCFVIMFIVNIILLGSLSK